MGEYGMGGNALLLDLSAKSSPLEFTIYRVAAQAPAHRHDQSELQRAAR
jgi:hypothetical protein